MRIVLFKRIKPDYFTKSTIKYENCITLIKVNYLVKQHQHCVRVI